MENEVEGQILECHRMQQKRRGLDLRWPWQKNVSNVFRCLDPVHSLSELPSPCHGDPLGQRWEGPVQDEGYSGSHPHSFPG